MSVDLFDPHSSIMCHGLGPHVPLEGRGTENKYSVYLRDHVYPTPKHFYYEGRGLFYDDNSPGHLEQGVTGWFQEMHSPHLNTVKKHLTVNGTASYQESLRDLENESQSHA